MGVNSWSPFQILQIWPTLMFLLLRNDLLRGRFCKGGFLRRWPELNKEMGKTLQFLHWSYFKLDLYKGHQYHYIKIKQTRVSQFKDFKRMIVPNWVKASSDWLSNFVYKGCVFQITTLTSTKRKASEKKYFSQSAWPRVFLISQILSKTWALRNTDFQKTNLC